MNKSFYLNMKLNSLLVQLLAGFLLVILMIGSFNFLSFAFFKNNIQQQIVKYNKQNLFNTVDRYENHFKTIQGTSIQLFFDSKIQLISDLTTFESFELVNQIAEKINSTLENKLLHLDNIVLNYRNNSFVVDKRGSIDSKEFMTNLYVSKDYGGPFWSEQFKHTYQMRIFPQSEFYDKRYNTAGSYIPVVMKNIIDDRFYIAVFVNAASMFESFQNFADGEFSIMDSEGNAVFASKDSSASTVSMAELTGNDGVFQQDHHYYFYRKGAGTGLTYVAVIPNESIANQVSRLNLLLAALLIFVIAISVIASIFVSLKFNSPIQSMIKSIRKFNLSNQLPSKIEEFNIIYDQVKQIVQSNKNFHVELTRKTSELNHLGYMNKLKNIHTNISGLSEPNKPFYLVIFHITMTRRFSSLLTIDQARATYFINEFLNLSLSESFPGSVTLQMEKDQIQSLIFTDRQFAGLVQTLERLKHVFDRDKDYYYVTIAVHAKLHEPSQLTIAYETTNELIRQRVLDAHTQIITEWKPEPSVTGWSITHEQEFYSNLQAGNIANLMEIISSVLVQLKQKEAFASHYEDFAKEVLSKVIRFMISMKIDINSLLDVSAHYKTFKECVSIGDYKEYFEKYLTDIVQLIHSVKEQYDPIRSFLLNYMNEHYGEGITLEAVADKLNMSGGHLSRVFKEKMAMSFSDYLNELRIQKAKEMLMFSDLQIQEISEKVGYTSTNSFIRMFKKVTGIPPGEFRKMNTLSIAGSPPADS